MTTDMDLYHQFPWQQRKDRSEAKPVSKLAARPKRGLQAPYRKPNRINEHSSFSSSGMGAHSAWFYEVATPPKGSEKSP